MEERNMEEIDYALCIILNNFNIQNNIITKKNNSYNPILQEYNAIDYLSQIKNYIYKNKST